MSRLLFFILVGTAFLVACDQGYDLNTFSIGDEFIQSETSIAIVDTYTVRMSTMLVDSITTSGKEVLLAGSYIDDEFGVISSKSYFRVGLPSFISLTDQDRFDSLILVLKRKDLVYGDTLKQQTLNVYRLAEGIRLNSDDKLYNTSSFRYDESPVGSKTFTPILEKEFVRIRLSYSFGLGLFEEMAANQFVLNDEFLDYLKGLVIVPETEDGAILAFKAGKDDVSMVLHTHKVDDEDTDISFKFKMINPQYQFNQISADRTGTQLQNLNDKFIDLPSGATGNKSFMQAGTGLMTRLEFPSLGTLLEGTQNYLLVKAELILKPVPFSYKKFPLPSSLVLYESNKYNQIVKEITGDNNSILPAKLYLDKVYNEDTYYIFNITDFITEELSDAFFDVDHALLVGLTNNSMGASLDRVIFDARSNTRFKPQLKLYYVYYN